MTAFLLNIWQSFTGFFTTYPVFEKPIRVAAIDNEQRREYRDRQMRYLKDKLVLEMKKKEAEIAIKQNKAYIWVSSEGRLSIGYLLMPQANLVRGPNGISPDHMFDFKSGKEIVNYGVRYEYTEENLRVLCATPTDKRYTVDIFDKNGEDACTVEAVRRYIDVTKILGKRNFYKFDFYENIHLYLKR